MDEKKLDEWVKACEEADSRFSQPVLGCILTPLCHICQHYDRKRTGLVGNVVKLGCKKFEWASEKLADCDSYECEGFELNKKAHGLKMFTFDDNGKPIPKYTRN